MHPSDARHVAALWQAAEIDLGRGASSVQVALQVTIATDLTLADVVLALTFALYYSDPPSDVSRPPSG